MCTQEVKKSRAINMPQFSFLLFCFSSWGKEKRKARKTSKLQQFKIRFLAEANKVARDKDKVTLMSYEKCQRFAIVIFLFY